MYNKYKNFESSQIIRSFCSLALVNLPFLIITFVMLMYESNLQKPQDAIIIFVIKDCPLLTREKYSNHAFDQL